MTLRLRLVIALAALVLAGLTLFGATTYSLYSRSQYQRLDDQLRASAPFLGQQLASALGLGPREERSHGGPGSDDGPGPGHGGNPRPVVPLATYAELRDNAGHVVGRLVPADSSDRPSLPTTMATTPSRLSTVNSSDGSTRWRVYVSPQRIADDTVVAAAQIGEVARALRRLLFIEVLGGAALLAILSAGGWLILRRGLRPLEEMAGAAAAITSGDLSQRVEPSGGPSEVGRLGLAVNTMLEEIEAAFAERDATEQRLRQFLADASHELRTPLTSIQGFAELFRVGPEREHVDVPTILRRIEEESARMRVLVEDLLLLARLDETHPVEREPVDLAVLAADACSDAVALAPDRPITLEAPAPVVVSGDAGHLRQAIGNLVTNAVRHTPDGTPIEVGAHVDGDAAVVRVRDHGPGLDPEAAQHAFDRFWQADSARVGTAFGLGLSIVVGIAAEHGGTASATNEGEGGAVFTLRIPLDPDRQRP
jgi:two-component system OmpR family sensor kinase